jgi:hypothetical protein
MSAAPSADQVVLGACGQPSRVQRLLTTFGTLHECGPSCSSKIGGLDPFGTLHRDQVSALGFADAVSPSEPHAAKYIEGCQGLTNTEVRDMFVHCSEPLSVRRSREYCRCRQPSFLSESEERTFHGGNGDRQESSVSLETEPGRVESTASRCSGP